MDHGGAIAELRAAGRDDDTAAARFQLDISHAPWRRARSGAGHVVVNLRAWWRDGKVTDVVISRCSVILLVLLFGVVGATACKTTVRTDTLEQRVRDHLARFGIPITRISCPEGAPVAVGTKFSCEVEFAGKKTYKLDATIRDMSMLSRKGEADFAWRDGIAVRVADLARMMHDKLTEDLAIPLAVNCGDEPLRFLDAQRKLGCEVIAGDARSTLTMEFDEHVDVGPWKLEPALVVPALFVQRMTAVVRAKTNPRVVLDCGPKVAYPRPSDGIVWCTVTDENRRARLKVEVDDKLDMQRWSIVDAAAKAE